MARRDAEATRRKILESAIAEFAEFGLAGARVERIVERAGTSVRMLYAYYGNKDGLFDTVVAEGIDRIHRAVPFTPDDLPGYVSALIDYAAVHPELPRIEAWRQLERPEPTEAERAMWRAKIEALRADPESAPTPPGLDAVDVLVLVLGLAGAWMGIPLALAELSERDGAARKAMTIEAVTRLLAPTGAAH